MTSCNDTSISNSIMQSLINWKSADKLDSAVSRAILSQCTGLESQTQTPKFSKVLISGVSFRHRLLSQFYESHVLSYSEYKIAKIFRGFAPRPHWGGLSAIPPPRLPSCADFPQKLLDTALLENTNHVLFKRKERTKKKKKKERNTVT